MALKATTQLVNQYCNVVARLASRSLRTSLLPCCAFRRYAANLKQGSPPLHI